MNQYPFVIDMPPSKNKLYRNVSENEKRYFTKRRGRTYTNEYKAWKDKWKIILSLSVKLPKLDPKSKVAWGLSRTELFYTWLNKPKGRAPDPFNCFTPLIDLISEVIKIDDNITRLVFFDGFTLHPSDKKSDYISTNLLTWENREDFEEWKIRLI